MALQIELRARQAYGTLVSAEAQIIADEERLNASRAALIGVERGQSAGLYTTLDVLNSLNQVQQAELSLIQTQYNRSEALTDIAYLTGRLIE